MQPFGPILNLFDAVADVCNTFFFFFFFNGNVVSDLRVGDA